MNDEKKKKKPVLMLVDLSPDEVAFLFSYNPISIHPVPCTFPRSHFRRLRYENGRLFIYFEIGVLLQLSATS